MTNRYEDNFIAGLWSDHSRYTKWLNQELDHIAAQCGRRPDIGEIRDSDIQQTRAF